jgi:hypothetical protein
VSARREIRLEDLLGREVLAGNNRTVGRIEEFRGEIKGDSCEITGFVIGVAGLYERLGLSVKMVFGNGGGGHLARWDQIDLSDPHRPRLTCSVDELATV